MIEKVRINYRDFDVSSFDINDRNIEKEIKYKELLPQALKAIPQNDIEREILDDYIKILKQIISCYGEINEIRNLIQASPSDTLPGIEDLKKTATYKAACIYSLEQELFVISTLDSNLLGKVLARTNNKREQKKKTLRVSKHSIKKNFFETLGVFGAILFFVIRLIIAILPFVMIGGNFFVTLLLIGLETFLPFTTAIFWIWGLVCAIKGVQDVWAIMYYIVFVVVWIPFYISTIVSLFKKK